MPLIPGEVEFLEAAASVSEPSAGGVGQEWATSWKIYGPDLDGNYGGLQGTGSLKAIVAGRAHSSVLHDFNGHMIGRVTHDGWLYWQPAKYTAFGPKQDATIPWLNAGVTLHEATNYRGRKRGEGGSPSRMKSLPIPVRPARRGSCLGLSRKKRKTPCRGRGCCHRALMGYSARATTVPTRENGGL